MKVADLTTGSGKLHHALKTLHAKWDQTRNEWHDPVSLGCPGDDGLRHALGGSDSPAPAHPSARRCKSPPRPPSDRSDIRFGVVGACFNGRELGLF